MLKETIGLAYRVYNDYTNKHVLDIYYNGSEYSVELVEKTGLPILVNSIDWENARVIQAGRPNPKSVFIQNWLEDRVIPPNRDMLKEILLANQIYEYDWRVLIRLNHGKCTDDPFRVEAVEMSA